MPDLCRNCSTQLSGGFCSQCGQSTADFDLPVAEFAKELAAETLSLDSRLRVTMNNLFFKPGAVALEYVQGHRARFVPPVRLYLFSSFAMFLVLALGSGLTVENVTVNGTPLADSTVTADEASVEAGSRPAGDGLAARFGDRMAEGLARVSTDREAFTQDFLNRMTRALFVLLPVFALLLKVVYRRRLYVHHLVFATYLHCFAFLVVAIVGIPDALGLTGVGRVASALLLTVPVYALIAMKRFYGEGRMKTFAKFVGVGVAYTVVSMAAWIGVLVLTLLAG